MSDIDEEFHAFLKYLNRAERSVVQQFVAARVAAARAATAEQIADAIQNTTYYAYPPLEGEERARLSGLRTARDAAAALARSVPGTTPETP